MILPSPFCRSYLQVIQFIQPSGCVKFTQQIQDASSSFDAFLSLPLIIGSKRSESVLIAQMMRRPVLKTSHCQAFSGLLSQVLLSIQENQAVIAIMTTPGSVSIIIIWFGKLLLELQLSKIPDFAFS